jgi:hypothetical protein
MTSSDKGWFDEAAEFPDDVRTDDILPTGPGGVVFTSREHAADVLGVLTGQVPVRSMPIAMDQQEDTPDDDDGSA